MRRLLFLLVLLHIPLLAHPQKQVTGRYYLTCCPLDVYEYIELRPDSTFKYEFHFSMGNTVTEGKWRMSGDTILLYDFRDPQANHIDTVIEKELPGDDFITIVPVRQMENQPVSKFTLWLNGNCAEQHPLDSMIIRMPQQEVHTIQIEDGYYKVKNKKANHFTLVYFNFRLNIAPRPLERNKWLWKGNKLHAFDCKGMLDDKVLERKE